MQELPKQYDHNQAQARWYPFWLEKGYFHSEPDPQRKPFTIVIPPPNVTGALHLGHALNNTLQDTLIRWRRMQGFNTLWMPGTDHAGIATQAVVERRLLEEEKKTRHDLGREALVERIWQWKHDYEKRILGQLQQMGCSCDWERTRFTLDDQCARAVRHTFFRMFQDGLIYRGKRLVNWDTFLQTAVSDDEVFNETVKGNFWHFRYPVIDPKPGEPTHVTIATTRPETMLGDTAVAVHPDPAAALDKVEKELQAKLVEVAAKDKPLVQAQLDDLVERRKSLLPTLIKLRDMAKAGRQLNLPLLNRAIPLVADEWAKPELGSGCVKITPAHDPNDYEVGKRQSLPMVNILNPEGTLNESAGQYQKLTIAKARQQVVADLEALGLMEKVEDRDIELPMSDRSKTPIEPYLADQWFVKMDKLAQSAMDAVTDGRVKIKPDRYAKSYLDWLGEKRDWPVSRQLWWGHRIPIWYAPTVSEADLKSAFAARRDVNWHRAEGKGWLICAQEEDLSATSIPGHQITQDPDVLDTWFSSALWPHSTLGWPDETPELKYYYPTSTLITSRDIITLWVARMVLTGLYNLGEIPFREVFIHPKILDGYGETMSKSKGNGVDPLDVIDKFGADSLRFGLAYICTETQDVRMPVEFECPHCQTLIEQTKKNRVQPRVECKKCGKSFSTQWATKPEDKALPRGAVVSDRFELGRNFCNKLWNASRFAMMNLEGYSAAPVKDAELTVEDRWLLSRLATVTQQVSDALGKYLFADAAHVLYDFAWNEFCSFYVEMVKSRLQDASQRGAAQRVLAHALDTILRLLHPMIPFITEEVWQLLGQVAAARGLAKPQAAAESIMIAPWPEADTSRQDLEIEARFARFQEVLGELRKIRSQQNIPPRETIHFVVRCDATTMALLKPMEPYFESMAGAKADAWGEKVQPPSNAASAPIGGMEVHVDLADFIDVEAEKARLTKDIARYEQAIGRKQGQLANESFVSRAPANVIEKERAELARLQEQLASARASLAALVAKK
jgi:valyl-tRNA synthetase